MEIYWGLGVFTNLRFRVDFMVVFWFQLANTEGLTVELRALVTPSRGFNRTLLGIEPQPWNESLGFRVSKG